MKKVILGMLFVFLLTLVISSVLLLRKPQLKDRSSESPVSLDLHNYTIAHFGKVNNLSIQVITKFIESGAKVIISNELFEFLELNASLIVMLDTEWVQEKINDKKLHDFLRNATPKEVKLVALGGNTSKLFETLDKAGVYEIPVTETGQVRNPAYNNPPLVGLKMKTAYTPNGYRYLYPSIMLSGVTAHNIDEIVHSIIAW